MQQKKYLPNPEVQAFNIRKVNKKTIGNNKEKHDFLYYTPETDHERKLEIYLSSSNLLSDVDSKKEKEAMLDQTVNEAIINSKAYMDLKKQYI